MNMHYPCRKIPIKVDMLRAELNLRLKRLSIPMDRAGERKKREFVEDLVSRY
jgi:hypothetical protein